MEFSTSEIGATAGDTGDESQRSEARASDTNALMLRIRQAYESGQPLYPVQDVNQLLQFAAHHHANSNAVNRSYLGLDYFGHEQLWTFSKDQLQ